MTIDEERLRAIDKTRDFLMFLTSVNRKTTINELRQKARELLRHYPEEWWVRSTKFKRF